MYGRVGGCCRWMGKSLIIARLEWNEAMTIELWIYESLRRFQTQLAMLNWGSGRVTDLRTGPVPHLY